MREKNHGKSVRIEGGGASRTGRDGSGGNGGSGENGGSGGNNGRGGNGGRDGDYQNN